MKKKLSQIDPVTLSRILFGIFIALTLFFASTTYYFYTKLQEKTFSPQVLSAKIKTNPLSLLEALREFMVLPDEDPVIATVSDKNQAQDQDFFRNAENGDKIIVFTRHQQVILYRPSINKIINVGSGIYQAPSPKPFVAATESGQQTFSPKILINALDENAPTPSFSPPQ